MVGAYLSSFSFGAFPNRLDQQLMVEIASVLLMAVETDAAMQKTKKNKKGRGFNWTTEMSYDWFDFIHTALELFSPLSFFSNSFVGDTLCYYRNTVARQQWSALSPLSTPFCSSLALCSAVSPPLSSFAQWPLVLFSSLRGQAGAWHLIESIFYYDSVWSVWGFTTPL